MTVEGQTEWVEARIRWAGGGETATRLRRPVSRLEQLGSAGGLRRRVEELKAEGLTAPGSPRGWMPKGCRASDGRPFTAAGVRRLLSRYGLSSVPPRRSGPASGRASGSSPTW